MEIEIDFPAMGIYRCEFHFSGVLNSWNISSRRGKQTSLQIEICVGWINSIECIAIPIVWEYLNRMNTLKIDFDAKTETLNPKLTKSRKHQRNSYFSVRISIV